MQDRRAKELPHLIESRLDALHALGHRIELLVHLVDLPRSPRADAEVQEANAEVGDRKPLQRFHPLQDGVELLIHLVNLHSAIRAAHRLEHACGAPDGKALGQRIQWGLREYVRDHGTARYMERSESAVAEHLHDVLSGLSPFEQRGANHGQQVAHTMVLRKSVDLQGITGRAKLAKQIGGPHRRLVWSALSAT